MKKGKNTASEKIEAITLKTIIVGIDITKNQSSKKYDNRINRRVLS